MEVKGDLNIDGTLTVNNLPVTGGSGLSNVVDDTTPQLGGDLDVNGFDIVTADVTGGNTPNPIDINGGDADTRSGASINITGGSSVTNQGGSVNLSGGDADSGSGGDVNLFGGATTSGATSGSIVAQTQYNPNGDSGSLLALIGSVDGVGNGGVIEMAAGNAGGTGAGGHVAISSGSAATPGQGGDITLFSGNDINITANYNVEVTGVGSVHLKPALASFYVESQKVQFAGQVLHGIGTPVNNSDAANKAYVDSVAGGGGGDINATGDFNLTSPNGITITAGTDGSGGSGDFIQLQTDLAFYQGAASGGIGISVGTSTNGNGGSISISAGIAVNSGNGGDISIVGGDTNSGISGGITIAPGVSVLGTQSGVTIGVGDDLAGHIIDLLDPVNMHSNLISSLAEPVSAQDAATKNYVDTHTSAGGGGGFYGILWRDGTRSLRTDRLSFNGTEFYLEGFRPTLNIKESGIDHNLLANLTVGDPHTQYIRVDGTRAFTGAQSMGSNKLTNVTDPTSAQDAATKNYVDTTMTPGFYGVVWSDGTVTKKTDRLSFGNQYFYLDGRKPTVNLREAGIDHNLLANLTVGDPHTQYIRVDGTRAFTGDQSHGGFKITSLGTPTAATDGATKAYVDTAVGPGFYGIFIRESDGNPPTAKKDTIIFDSTAFYINSDSKGLPMVSFRGSVGSPGITGIDVKDDVHNITNKTKVNFNGGGFYLSQTSAGDPMVNLKYEKDLYPIYLDFPTTQQVAVDTWAQYPYTIEKVDFDCFSGSATGGFYIIRAANRATARDGIQVTNLDPMPISTTPRTQFATGNNSVLPGDVVQFSLYQNSSGRRVRIMLTCKKS